MIKKRLFTGWDFARILYLLLGLLVIGQSVSEAQWLGLLPGGYIASMGLFAFGCASGNCSTGNCDLYDQDQKK